MHTAEPVAGLGLFYRVKISPTPLEPPDWNPRMRQARPALARPGIRRERRVGPGRKPKDAAPSYALDCRSPAHPVAGGS